MPSPRTPGTTRSWGVSLLPGHASLAGFNYVDDQCTAYFDQLYFIDRERGQLKSGLAAASGTTAAILGVTNASTLTMSVVASAFGFASAATDILAGTYFTPFPPPPRWVSSTTSRLPIAVQRLGRASTSIRRRRRHRIQSSPRSVPAPHYRDGGGQSGERRHRGRGVGRGRIDCGGDRKHFACQIFNSAVAGRICRARFNATAAGAKAARAQSNQRKRSEPV